MLLASAIPAPEPAIAASNGIRRAVPPDAVTALLDSLLDSPVLAQDFVGLVVLDRDGRVKYARNADRRFIPASTRKVLVTAAALSLFGSDASVSTEVFAAGKLHGERLSGDLILAGAGDPSLEDAGLADLAAQVASAGIRVVEGGLMADASRFRPDVDYGQGWAYDDQPFAYASRVSALVVNRNATADVVASENPPAFAISKFKDALSAAGVVVTGPSAFGAVPPDARRVAYRASPSIESLIAHTNKASDNLYAEILLRHLGRIATPDATVPSVKLGLEVEAEWLGWPRETYRLVDGSGLSRYDLLTPRQVADVLYRMRNRQDFRRSLAVAGVDGTMAGRLAGTRAAGRVYAKTGTLSGVSALAGYIGDRWTFAFMVNGHVGPLAAVRAIQDAMCLALSPPGAAAPAPADVATGSVLPELRR
jgi:D-alanyl-D-alanine carboxypeptidase/D-alanyl-D-alanine-endopeptidase (penicillin-binding protein 4)